jgi:hypothetical protein
VARVHLGLTDRQFYALTPRQYHVLLDQHRECVEHQDYHRELLTGIIASTVANFAMGAPKKPLSPRDFMPSRSRGGRARATSVAIDRKQVAEDVRAWLSRMKTQPGSVVTVNPKTKAR